MSVFPGENVCGLQRRRLGLPNPAQAVGPAFGWPMLWPLSIEESAVTQYMVIENFLPGCKDAVYERFAQKGRMLPQGLKYMDSWLEKNGDRCFQLMETHDRSLFDEWIENWKDLTDFEVVEIGAKPIKGGDA